MRNRLRAIVRATALVAALASPLAMASPSYSTTDLNPYAVGTFAATLTASGTVLGMFQTTGGTLDAFAVNASTGAFTGLGNYGADSATAVGVSSSGQIAISTPFSGAPTTTMLNADSSTTTIANFSAVGMNASGAMAGGDASGNAAYLSSSSGTVQSIAGSGWQSSTASGINSSGQVVGSFIAADGSSHAFLTGANGGAVTDLGLGGASAVNDSGTATGWMMYSSGDSSDLMETVGGNRVDLGSLSEGVANTFMFGEAINSAGDIVGVDYSGTTNTNTAFLYANGRLENLNNLLSPTFTDSVTITAVNGIDDNGDILLTGTTNADGVSRVYLLSMVGVDGTPPVSVPEPALAGLLGLGLVGLRRRRVAGRRARASVGVA